MYPLILFNFLRNTYFVVPSVNIYTHVTSTHFTHFQLDLYSLFNEHSFVACHPQKLLHLSVFFWVEHHLADVSHQILLPQLLYTRYTVERTYNE